MAEIIQLDPDIPTVSGILKRSETLSKILVLGIDSEGKDFYGMSGLKTPDILYLMEKCKHFLMKLEE